MSKCDIKESGKASNDGMEAFQKAFKMTGKVTESIKFAVDEIHRQNPDFDFEISSFSDPLINTLKEKDIIPKNYKFAGSKEKASSVEKKIDKIVEKMKGLSPDQKKAFARKAFTTFEKDGMLTDEKVKNFYAEAIGIPSMNERIGDQITKTSKALLSNKENEEAIQTQIKQMQADKTANEGKLTPDQDKAYTKAFAELSDKRSKLNASMMKESSEFANMLQEKKFWLHQLTDYMPLNLMNPNSLIKNVSGAVIDGIVRTLGNSIASPVSQVVSIFTKINSNPIGSKVKGLANAKVKEKASAAWKYGSTDFNNELPRANSLNAANRFRQAMDATGGNKFKGIISGILKIHPDIISKGLTVPDAVAYEGVIASELNSIADAKSLTGAEKSAFLLSPDEKSIEVATKLAQQATFKQDLPGWLSGIKKLSAYDPHEQTKKLIEAGMSPLSAKLRTGLRSIVQKSAVPFIKTPINIMRTASMVLLPEYALGQALIDAKKETDPLFRQKLIIEGTTKAAVYFFIRHIAIQMVTQGLISAGYGDEDKKTKDIVEQELGGPNRINYSALVRGLTFRDIKKQSGDKFADLNSLGALGIVMAVYAHAYSKDSKEDIQNHTSYNKNLLNAISVPWDLSWATLSSAMDFTFFTGINQLQGAVMNKEGYEADRYAIQVLANVFTGIAPSTYQKFSTQYSPEVKKQFDTNLNFHENLVNALGYRFAFQSKDLRNKYFSLAEKGEGGLKKKEYVLFDNYLGRVLEAEFDFAKVTTAKTNDPISRLHEALKEVPKDERDKLFPASISADQTIQTRKGGRNTTYKVDLTPQQHDYLQEQASSYRMMLATPFIMSEDFKKADHETKSQVLQSFYQEGLKMAKKDLKSRFPEINTQKAKGEPDKKTVKKLIREYK